MTGSVVEWQWAKFNKACADYENMRKYAIYFGNVTDDIGVGFEDFDDFYVGVFDYCVCDSCVKCVCQLLFGCYFSVSSYRDSVFMKVLRSFCQKCWI